LRPHDTRNGRQRGSARRKMQKIPATKFHWCPPLILVMEMPKASQNLHLVPPAYRKTS
jgi:hypothetical protein